MAYLNPAILELLGLRQRPEDEEEMDASREGERGPVSPYAGITPTATSPVASPTQPSPYRSIPWVTEQPSTAKPDETVRREIQVPITEGPSGERTLRAPEGTATWTPGQLGQPDSALARRMGAGRGPGVYNTETGTFTPRAEEERRGTLMAEAGARKETQRQNLIADILSTSRSYWGKPTVGPKGEVSGGEADRGARVGELLTVLKEIYGTSALGGILGAGEGGGAGPGGLVPTGVTVDEKGNIKRTFGLPPSARVGGGPGSRSYEDYVREAETKWGLTGADRTRYAEKEMRRATEEAAFAKSQQGVLGGATGPAADAKATLARRIAEQTTRAREQAKLDYLRLPADAGNRYALYKQVERDVGRIEELFQPWMVGKGFQAAQGFQPLKQAFQQFEQQAASGQYQPGALFGAIREWTGSASAEEVEFRQAIADAANTILYARSGAQINEQEFQRLKGALFSVWAEPTVFLTRLNSVKGIVNNNITSILEAGATPIKEIQSARGGGQAVPSQGGTLPRSNAGEEVRWDKQGRAFVRRNGQKIQVQP